MSTDVPTRPSDDTAGFRLQELLSPQTGSLFLIWLAVALVAGALYYFTSRQSDEFRKGMSATQSTLSDLDQRLRAGDSSAIAEIEAMRRRVQDFDRALTAQREQFQQLTDRADVARSRKAVDRAKVAVLQADVTTMRNRLQKLKQLYAQWAAQKGTLLTGDPGRRIVASPTHFSLLTGLLDGEQLSDVDLHKWELQLESLAAPVQASEQTEIAISDEHVQQLSDLGKALTVAVAKLDQQLLLLEAILQETANIKPTEVTLERALRERQTQVELQSAERLAKAREDARLAAEKAQAERLAQLEQDIVVAKSKAEAEALEARKAQAAQLGRAELDRIAEETKVKEAQKRAEIAGLKATVKEVDAAIKAAALERDFERDLPEIKGLLSAFLSDGFKYRADNAKGPASLSHIASQKGLELNANGSYAMAFLANSSDRPAGGLKNPAGPDRIRRAQDLLIKYGDLMVRKKMLEP